MACPSLSPFPRAPLADALKNMRRIHDGDDDDDDDGGGGGGGGGDGDGDDACAECALPCLFLLGPAAVFLVLGLGALHGWSHETGSSPRDAALVELRSAVGRWEKHRPLLEGLRFTANLSVPGLQPQHVEFRPTSTSESVPPCVDTQSHRVPQLAESV